MQITYRVALEIATHEALVRQAYRDSRGKWTWSIGLTGATGHNVTRYIGKPQTVAHCLAVYVWALNNYAEAVRAEFAVHDLAEHEFAAALSFHWHTGAISSALWPDLWKAGRREEARESFLSWRKPPEIVKRRKKEARLLFDGQWSQNGKVGEYTRLHPNGTPVWKSRRNLDISKELSALLGAPAPVPEEDPVPGSAAHKLARIRAILEEPEEETP